MSFNEGNLHERVDMLERENDALGEKGTCTYRTHERLRNAVARLVADARARA